MKSTITHLVCPLILPFLVALPGAAIAQAPPVTTDPIGASVIPQIQPDTGLQRGLQEPTLQPFGANLFRGRFTAEREDGLNPDYVLQQGDRITLRIWGAIAVDESVIVDPQGNIFIPNVGPVHVQGVQNAALNSHIEQAIRRVYRANVSIYTNLEAVTPVSAYVTGFVNNPGSYAGLASDSLLYFLDRAGGIDPKRGSFRDIRILRGGKVMEEVDLYDFLISGQISHRQFTDGDTILVGRRGASITVMGAARNTFSFEIPGEGMTGSNVIDLAKVFTFEAIPAELDAEEAKHVLGGQAQVWGELIPSEQHREYQTYPRACALIERIWSPPDHDDYGQFLGRLEHHTGRLDAAGIHYRPLD